MSFLSSMFGAGAGSQAYNPATAQQITGATQNQQLQQQNLYGQQNDFANQLLKQSQGQGPSVANQQLQQALQQQQASAASQAASQRGVNPAAAMRTSMEQQGANAQATAQSAAIARAGEALGAQGQLGGVLQGMGTQNLQGQQLTQQMQGANQAADLSAQQITHQAGQAQNQAQSGLVSGIASGLGSGLMAMVSEGGVIPHFDGGGMAGANPLSVIGQILLGGSGNKDSGQGGPTGPVKETYTKKFSGPSPASLNIPGPSNYSDAIQSMTGAGLTPEAANAAAREQGYAMTPMAGLASGGKVPAMLSPGEIRVPAEKTKNPKEAEKYAANAAKSGKKIPGKAKVSGDSIENDTVPMELNEGDVIVKRSQAKDPNDAAAFVRALLASQRGNKNG